MYSSTSNTSRVREEKGTWNMYIYSTKNRRHEVLQPEISAHSTARHYRTTMHVYTASSRSTEIIFGTSGGIVQAPSIDSRAILKIKISTCDHGILLFMVGSRLPLGTNTGQQGASGSCSYPTSTYLIFPSSLAGDPGTGNSQKAKGAPMEPKLAKDRASLQEPYSYE